MLLSLESEFLNFLNYLSLLKLKTRAHIEIDSLKTAGGQTHRGMMIWSFEYFDN